jgi:hypothetical protein
MEEEEVGRRGFFYRGGGTLVDLEIWGGALARFAKLSRGGGSFPIRKFAHSLDGIIINMMR